MEAPKSLAHRCRSMLSGGIGPGRRQMDSSCGPGGWWFVVSGKLGALSARQPSDLFMANSSFTPPSVFDRAHDNVAANGTIEDSRPSIQMFRSAFSRTVQIFQLFDIIGISD